MSQKIIPDVIEGRDPIMARLQDNSAEVAALMAKHNIGAVLVVDSQSKLKGIVTERDMTRRIIAKGLDPKKTTVKDIMTSRTYSVRPDSTAIDALAIMKKKNIRHLPVLEKGQIVGIVSIRDLYSSANAQLQEDIQQREAFIFGVGYGG